VGKSQSRAYITDRLDLLSTQNPLLHKTVSHNDDLRIQDQHSLFGRSTIMQIGLLKLDNPIKEKVMPISSIANVHQFNSVRLCLGRLHDPIIVTRVKLIPFVVKMENRRIEPNNRTVGHFLDLFSIHRGILAQKQ
jgi:hypothetical protein